MSAASLSSEMPPATARCGAASRRAVPGAAVVVRRGSDRRRRSGSGAGAGIVATTGDGGPTSIRPWATIAPRRRR